MKKVAIVIGVLFLIYIILAFAGPSNIKVERKTTINKPKTEVQKYMGDLKFFHDKWSPYTELDPNMKTEYSGTAGQPGHKYVWSGNKDVKSGELEFTQFKEDSMIQKLNYDKMGDQQVYYILNENNNATEVTWGMAFPVGFFMRPMMLFMNMDKMMGPDYEKGLSKLKTSLEEMKAEAPIANYEIKEINWEETSYVGKKEVVNFDKMKEFFEKNYMEIGTEMGKAKVQPMGAPVAVYWKYDEVAMNADLAAAFKVAKGTKLKGYETYNFPASKVLMVAYYGDYANSKAPHEAIGKYMNEKGLKENVVVEEYITDPMTEKDTAKWLTNIYYLLK